jgi:hypothetical protein
MGAIATVKLNGSVLPGPTTYRKDVEFVGGSVTLANGTVRRDLVRTAAARKYALAWVALTTTQKGTLETAWAAAVAGEVSFESPDGDNVSVTAPPDARLSFEAYQSQNSLLWKSAIELWEV